MKPTVAPGDDDDGVDLEIDLLLEAVFRRFSYDFRHYARASLRRRVLGAVQRFGVESVSQLQHLVLHDRQAFDQLLEQLTVPVSDVFRDDAYFTALRRVVAPVLATYASLKVWVAGCGTGEEVYSLAILFDELGLLPRTLIYATDISPLALRRAEAGVYPIDRVQRYTRNYQAAGGIRSLSDYYTSGYAQVVFDRRLRSRVTFSDHCLATDNVFAEVHLVSCRNVLIYFDGVQQERALELFRASLVPRGYLGLGSRESLRGYSHAAHFEAVDHEARLYRSRA